MCSSDLVPPLGSKEWAGERAAGIGPEASDVSFGVPGADAGSSAGRGPADPRDPNVPEDADTVLLCVADDEGNVVSYINSRFAGFGSGLVAGDTGIALQNRGASFSLADDHPNRLEPGKRPVRDCWGGPDPARTNSRGSGVRCRCRRRPDRYRTRRSGS